MTRDEFIEKAKKVHGDKFDYSKVEYKNNKTKVCIICPEHGEFWQRPDQHLRGRGCNNCRPNRKLTTEEFIQRAKEIHGDKYDYSKVEYVDMKTKICIVCPTHGDFWTKPLNHIYGKKTGCPECAHNIWTSEKFIEEAKKVHGNKYDYSKVEFKTTRDKVCIISKELDRYGNVIGEFWQLPLDHLKGNRYYKERGVYSGKRDESCWEVRICPICGKEFEVRKKYEKITCSEECRLKYVELHKDEINMKKKESRKKTMGKLNCDELKEYYKKANERGKKTCLEKYGVDSFSKTEVARKFLSEKMKKQKKEWDEKRIENVIIPKYTKICEDDNLTLIKFNNRFDCDVKCKICGTEFKTKTLGYLTENATQNICRVCHPIEQIFGPTELEQNFESFLISLGVKYMKNCRSIITPMEVDFYLPEYNVGFELDGLYWHCEVYRDEKYHIEKTNMCNEKGVRLIHIFEDEWYNKNDICKSRIKSILGMSENIIYARKCSISVVDRNTTKEFLRTNHIQGNTIFKYSIGLYYNDELVSLMTFGSLRKNLGSNSRDGSYELLRFCNKLNTNVVGGSSRLLKYFIEEYAPNRIISYCDLRWSEGNMYEKIGFTLNHISQPNYFYFIEGERKNRFEYRKSELVKKYGCPIEMSEHEFCLSQKWYRIYDCGNKVFEMKMNPESF